MNAINVKIEDAALVTKLTSLANAHQRSVEAEAVEVIRAALSNRSNRELLAIADSIAAMTPKGRKLSDSTALIREDRDREG